MVISTCSFSERWRPKDLSSYWRDCIQLKESCFMRHAGKDSSSRKSTVNSVRVYQLCPVGNPSWLKLDYKRYKIQITRQFTYNRNCSSQNGELVSLTTDVVNFWDGSSISTTAYASDTAVNIGNSHFKINLSFHPHSLKHEYRLTFNYMTIL